MAFPPEAWRDRRSSAAELGFARVNHDLGALLRYFFASVFAPAGGAATLTFWPSAMSAGGLSATRSPPFKPSRNSSFVP
jgi:hypothetical protein